MPKISALPSASTLVGTELVPVVQSGATRQATINQLFGTTVTLFSTYTLFRAYTGTATVAYLNDTYLGGMYVRGSDVTSADNGGTVIIDGSSRRWRRVYNGVADPRWFGAAANNSTNDRVALQSAASSVVNGYMNGGTVNIGGYSYLTGASGGACVSIVYPTRFKGLGGVYSCINPSSATSGDDTFLVTPSTSFDHGNTGFEKISMLNPSTGVRTGRHGIYVDTGVAGANLPKYTIRDSIIGQGSGYGFLHINSIANNVNGGMYGALFQNNQIKGGIGLNNSGDSNSILHNILSGTGYGIIASNTPGASLLEIQSNNITSSYGAISISLGDRFRILGNNIEHYVTGAATNNNAAIVDLNGSNGVMYGGVVKENLISGFGTSDATKCLRMRNCRGTLVQDNTFLSGVAGLTTAIDIGSDCQNVRIGSNGYNVAITTKVNDAGIGTMGVTKTATLQNGWVAYDGVTTPLEFIKSIDGMVHIYGTIKSGTITDGTVVTSLPTGFRPTKTIRAHGFYVDTGVAKICEINIDSSGNLSIKYVSSSATNLNINITFSATDLANSVAV